MFNARQGDVTIKQIEKLPDGLRKLDTLTVRFGEATGHHHSLVVEEPNRAELYQDEKGVMCLHVEGGAVLTHQEHKPLTLPAGDYLIGDERELDPIEGIRKTID